MMTNFDRLISVITPSYNSSEFVLETIRSVQAQTYTNWEMLIVDDCSTDNSVELIKQEAAKDSRIKLFQLSQNSGAAVTRNTAIQNAKGDFLAFLDADDLWEPTKLETQITFMIEHKAAFTYTRYIAVDKESNDLRKNLRFPDKVSYKDLLKTCSIGCLTVMIDKTAFNDVSMPLLRRGQDYALWLRLLKETEYAYCIPELLAKYRIAENSLSRNKFKKLRGQWNIYRVTEKLPFFRSLFYIVHYIYWGWQKNH